VREAHAALFQLDDATSMSVMLSSKGPGEKVSHTKMGLCGVHECPDCGCGWGRWRLILGEQQLPWLCSSTAAAENDPQSPFGPFGCRWFASAAFILAVRSTQKNRETSSALQSAPQNIAPLLSSTLQTTFVENMLRMQRPFDLLCEGVVLVSYQ